MKKSVCTSLLLLLAMLTVILAGCGGKTPTPDKPSSTTAPVNSGSPSGNPDNTKPHEPDPVVPIVKFDNQDVVFLTRNGECGDFETWDLVQTDLQGDAINSAINQRNGYVESTYEVNIVQRQFGGAVNGGEMYTAIYNDYMSGGGENDGFHIAYCGVTDAIALATNGIFYDLSELPNITLTASWWDETAMSNLTVANRYFFGVGDISVQLYETLPCLVFNKSMATDHVDGNLYDMVSEGTWTYQTFYDIIKDVYANTDDVAGPSVKDTFGAGGQNDNLYNFFYGSDCHTAVLNRNGDPELTIYSDTNNTVFDKLYEILTDKEAFFNCNDYANVTGWISSPIEYVTQGFVGGRILFYSDGLLHLPELREATFEFGILPVPKYTAEQTGYHHLIGVWGATVVTIPATCSDVKMTTLIMEAMGCESQKTVATEYFEQKLQLQSVRDSESAESLQIILDTKGFDLGQCFRWNELHLIMGDCLTQKNNSFYSNYQGKVDTINIEIGKTIEAYQSLPHYFELED